MTNSLDLGIITLGAEQFQLVVEVDGLADDFDLHKVRNMALAHFKDLALAHAAKWNKDHAGQPLPSFAHAQFTDTAVQFAGAGISQAHDFSLNDLSSQITNLKTGFCRDCTLTASAHSAKTLWEQFEQDFIPSKGAGSSLSARVTSPRGSPKVHSPQASSKHDSPSASPRSDAGSSKPASLKPLTAKSSPLTLLPPSPKADSEQDEHSGSPGSMDGSSKHSKPKPVSAKPQPLTQLVSDSDTESEPSPLAETPMVHGVIAQPKQSPVVDKRWLHFKTRYYMPIIRKQKTLPGCILDSNTPAYDREVLTRIQAIYTHHVERCRREKLRHFSLAEDLQYMIQQKEVLIQRVLESRSSRT
jgi:hypothetical protein